MTQDQVLTGAEKVTDPRTKFEISPGTPSQDANDFINGLAAETKTKIANGASCEEIEAFLSEGIEDKCREFWNKHYKSAFRNAMKDFPQIESTGLRKIRREIEADFSGSIWDSGRRELVVKNSQDDFLENGPKRVVYKFFVSKVRDYLAISLNGTPFDAIATRARNIEEQIATGIISRIEKILNESSPITSEGQMVQLRANRQRELGQGDKEPVKRAGWLRLLTPPASPYNHSSALALRDAGTREVAIAEESHHDIAIRFVRRLEEEFSAVLPVLNMSADPNRLDHKQGRAMIR